MPDAKLQAARKDPGQIKSLPLPGNTAWQSQLAKILTSSARAKGYLSQNLFATSKESEHSVKGSTLNSQRQLLGVTSIHTLIDTRLSFLPCTNSMYLFRENASSFQKSDYQLVSSEDSILKGCILINVAKNWKSSHHLHAKQRKAQFSNRSKAGIPGKMTHIKHGLISTRRNGYGMLSSSNHIKCIDLSQERFEEEYNQIQQLSPLFINT